MTRYIASAMTSERRKSHRTIKFGATVSLIEEDTGEHKIWQIVGEPVADAHKGNISVTSLIARALIGKTRGETVEVETPGGAKVCQVRKVEWLVAPDKSMNYGRTNWHVGG
jgi:transcription elongation factor GreA